jgi:hypothetical protein
MARFRAAVARIEAARRRLGQRTAKRAWDVSLATLGL